MAQQKDIKVVQILRYLSKTTTKYKTSCKLETESSYYYIVTSSVLAVHSQAFLFSINDIIVV